MKSFATRIAIRATPEALWGILINGAAWPEWNTTVERVEGRIAAAEKVTVRVKDAPGRAFPVKVVAFEAPHRMVWRGGMPLGLFSGERSYGLRALDAEHTEFSMMETYSGLMAPLITPSIPDLQPAFDSFAACLKTRAEARN